MKTSIRIFLFSGAVAVSGLLATTPHLAVSHAQSAGAVTAQTPAIGVTSLTGNPLQIALLHWYDANLTTTFPVGSAPSGAVFDGANIWVANYIGGSVTKVRASDGAILGTFAVGSGHTSSRSTERTFGPRITARLR